MPFSARKILSLIDLTRLNEGDDANHIHRFIQQATTPYGTVAAVCIYAPFVRLANDCLSALHAENVGVATVVNFPAARDSLTRIVAETKQALADGAQEIDLVLPYHELLAGDSTTPLHVVATLAAIVHSQNAKLKVIIESGALQTPTRIHAASTIAITGGADFVKTSTGKISVGATLDACDAICASIKASGKDVGIKLSGGIHTTAQARAYLTIIAHYFGAQWINNQHVRFGASSLLGDVLKAAAKEKE